VLLALSYLLAVVSINYKFHIFFASSFLLLFYPAFFFGQLSKLKRTAWLFAAFLLCAGAVYLSQRVRVLPYVSFDGSAYHTYMDIVKSMFENHAIQAFFSYRFSSAFPPLNMALNLLSNIAMIFLVTFGLIGISYFAAAFLLRKKMEKDLLLLPLLVIASFMIFSLFLSYEKHALATREELIHRPFVWAYYFVCIWVAGVAVSWLQHKRPKVTRLGPVLLALVLMPLGVASFFLSSNIQRGPPWGEQMTNLRVSNGLIACTSYIEANSQHDQVVQDSEYDKYGLVTALSRRHDYVTVSASSPQSNPEIASRLAAVAELSTYTTTAAVERFFSSRGISFYINHPGQKELSWPKELKGDVVFSRDGYDVYYFGE